jgi:hypothetical protein
MSGDVPISPSVLAALLASLLALAGLARRYRSLQGTTLRAPWCWTLAAVLALTVAELSATRLSAWAEQMRYLAAAATFCPLMAVLGAKRPQDRAWQFIVLSLWVVLALPGVQSAFSRPHAALDLHAAWRWFLLVLIAVGLFNSLPTRQWPSSLLAAGGQVCLLAKNLPISVVWLNSPSISALGTVLWCAAVALWGWDFPPRRKTEQPLDRLWLDFRDLLGTMWALRVLERINAASSRSGWGARLTWRGWIIGGEPQPALQRSLEMLLRRFVSPEWIARRMTP